LKLFEYLEQVSRSVMTSLPILVILLSFISFYAFQQLFLVIYAVFWSGI